jgi:hypothetical protein
VGILISCGSGCASLKKKFTRQKKKQAREEFIPVLDPIDYAPLVVSAQQQYQRHYSLWKIWQRDLVQNIEAGAPQKKQRYLFEQMIVQLREMGAWLPGNKRAELLVFVEELEGILASYETPAPLRDAFSIKRKIESNAKKVRVAFDPKVVQEHLVKDDAGAH